MKGKPTQFEGKAKVQITMLLASANSPLPAPVPNTAVVVWTQRTDLQKNAQWCNEESYEEDMGKRRTVETKGAMKIFADLAAGKIKQSEDAAGVRQRVEPSVQLGW